MKATYTHQCSNSTFSLRYEEGAGSDDEQDEDMKLAIQLSLQEAKQEEKQYYDKQQQLWDQYTRSKQETNDNGSNNQHDYTGQQRQYQERQANKHKQHKQKIERYICEACKCGISMRTSRSQQT